MIRLLRFLKSDLGQAALLILAFKLLIFVVADVAYILSIGESAPLRSVELFNIWQRWDADHYVSIAKFGYTALPGQPVLINFMPGYPCLIWLFSHLGFGFPAAALWVSNLASFFGLLIFYRLACLEFGAQEARTALLAIAVFPTAYFFNAPYSEGPFLLFSAGAFLTARKNRWAWAGLLGGAAALTRYMGVFLFPALLVDYWLRRSEMKKDWRPAAFLLLIPLIFSIYLAINRQVYGNPLAFVEFQHTYFARSLAWPWTGMVNIVKLLRGFAANNQGMTTLVFELGAGLFFAVGTVVAFKSLRLPYALFIAGSALISLTNSFLLGTPRYVLSAFPLFFLFRRVGRYPNLTAGLFFLSSALLALCAGLYVKGWWAF